MGLASRVKRESAERDGRPSLGLQGSHNVWTYGANPDKDSEFAFVVRIGRRTAALAKTKGDADMICRAGREAMREAMRSSIDARKNRVELDRLRLDIRTVMGALKKAIDVLKKPKPREITAVRENAARVMRALETKGFRV